MTIGNTVSAWPQILVMLYAWKIYVAATISPCPDQSC